MEAAARFEVIVCQGKWAEAGDADWEELIRRYGATLRAKIRQVLWGGGILADPGQIDEILQEVYCRLFSRGARTLRQFRGRQEDSLLNYLRAIASRIAIDHLRRHRAEKRTPRPPKRPGSFVAAFRGRGVDPRGNPEEILLGKEGARLLLAKCSRLVRPGLRPRNTRILCLAAEGWTAGEISKVLGGRLGPSGVDSLLFRLRRDLRV